jgi:FtsP/CotA-like multicopper oxidase with cupredoxin domain
MDMSSMDHGSMPGMGHGGMGGSAMAGMDHSAMPGMDHGAMDMAASATQGHDHKMGVGVDNLAMVQVSRIDEPGLGLESVPHRALRYSQLRSLTPNPDTRAPGREMEIHLTGNMERYMWSFDGVKLSEVTGPIIFHEGERLRVTLVNDTMMTHPIHLHGMFFDLVVGDTDHKPRKHTVTVKPAERISFDVTADHVGDWAFHCHLLFHMHAGMMQVVSVVPQGAAAGADDPHKEHTLSATPPTDEPPPKEAPMSGMSHEGHR